MNYSCFYLHTNERGQEPFIIFDKITFGKQEINITNNFLEMKKKKLSDINFQKFIFFFQNFEEKIKNEFKNNYCLRLELIFKNEFETIDTISNKKGLKYNITCKYIFYSPT